MADYTGDPSLTSLCLVFQVPLPMAWHLNILNIPQHGTAAIQVC